MIRKVQFLIIFFLFFLIFGEILLRIFGIGYLNNISERNTKFHHSHPKDFFFLSYDFKNKEWDNIKVYYDSYGNRHDKKKNKKIKKEKEIVFLGDSFTEAIQVDWNESFVGILEKKYPRIDIKNLAVITYSPSMYLLQTRELINNKNLAKIILQVYNYDFVDDEYYKVYSNAKNTKNPKEYVKQLEYLDYHHYDLKGELKFYLREKLKNSYLVRLVKRIQKTMFYQGVLWNNPSNTFIRENSITIEALKEIQKLCDENNIEFIVFLIPDKTSLLKNQEDNFYTSFKDIMFKNNINFIDTIPNFQNYKQKEKIFFKKDIHLTNIGHKLIAKSISKNLNF